VHQNEDVDDRRHDRCSRPWLLDDLTQFVSCHRPCGQLSGDASEPEASGYVLSLVCSCGVVFLRWVTLEEAAMELEMSDLATSTS
jgi:hypothetical protein